MEMVHFIPTSQRRLVLLAAQTDTAPVLIFGTQGTGKSSIAKWIHYNGPRSVQPILTANQDSPLLEQLISAQKGTLVIPEIGEWPRGEQKRLLDFLNSKSIDHPQNPKMKMLLNVRIIATTSQALENRALGGLFNEELLNKLNVFRVVMPNLSLRDEEFEDITLGILRELTRELQKEHIQNISDNAWTKLKNHNWPANLREMRNVLRVSVMTTQEDIIEAENLPNFEKDDIDFSATREQFEKNYIIGLLKAFDWEIDRTCEISKMDKTILLQKMNQYGIKPDSNSI